MFRKAAVTAVLVLLSVVLVSTGSFAAKPPKNSAPTVTLFDVQASSPSPVPVLAFTATDSDGTVTGYLITESSSSPSASDPGWTASPPSAYVTASVGLVTLYAWARDNEDAVSAGVSDTVDIPDPQDQIIADLQAAVADLQARLAAVEANSALQLDGYVEVRQGDMQSMVGPHVIFGGTSGNGVNVHIRSGDPGESTLALNGLGNLVLGYNEINPSPAPYELALLPDDRLGSHNLVLGIYNGFANAAGLVHGWGNVVRRKHSATIAGDTNLVESSYSAIMGGWSNKVFGAEEVIVGGYNNTASGVEGGIFGGANNTTTGRNATVVGGEFNSANGAASSVSGGQHNNADGSHSTVAGGKFNRAGGPDSTVAGGDNNFAGGPNAAIFGGAEHSANGLNAVVVGGLANQAVGDFSTISGGGLGIILNDYLGWCGGGNCTVP